MPEDLNLLWFPDPSQTFYGWWHPDGWVLYQNGETRAWPEDMGPEGANSYRFGFEDSVRYYRMDGAGLGPTFRGGGHIYYQPEFNRAFNTRSMIYSVVGRSLTGWPLTGANDGVHIFGYDAAWEFVPSPTGSVKRFWRPVATARPDGLGYYYAPGNPDGTRKYGVVIPYWSGRLYPEYEGRHRGRPPLA